MSSTILFADDNRNIREFCCRELEDEGYRVVLARNGLEAVERFRECAPDLVILDIAMPLADGFRAIEQIRALDASVPVVFFTSFDESCAEDPRARLATACVEKSSDLTELKRVVVSALQHRGPSGQYHVGLLPAAGEGSPEAQAMPAG
jgi:CheY-like chemotaxis protein